MFPCLTIVSKNGKAGSTLDIQESKSLPVETKTPSVYWLFLTESKQASEINFNYVFCEVIVAGTGKSQMGRLLMPLQTVISFAPNHAPCMLNAFLFSGSPASIATHISVTLSHNGPKICISTTHPTQSPGFLSHSYCSSSY